ncbi:hypothetical protein M758_11G154000 [Ceratodon purpureus]|nr:hypothetical protein M758_11G154000 [Ceratodon purpureus]
MDSLDVDLWIHELPPEIVEHVLSFLPLTNWQRYRLVCKRWNEILCTTFESEMALLYHLLDFEESALFCPDGQEFWHNFLEQ